MTRCHQCGEHVHSEDVPNDLRRALIAAMSARDGILASPPWCEAPDGALARLQDLHVSLAATLSELLDRVGTNVGALLGYCPRCAELDVARMKEEARALVPAVVEDREQWAKERWAAEQAAFDQEG